MKLTQFAKFSQNIKYWMRFRIRSVLLTLALLALFILFNQGLGPQLFTSSTIVNENQSAGSPHQVGARDLSNVEPDPFGSKEQDEDEEVSKNHRKATKPGAILTIWSILRDLDNSHSPTTQAEWLESLHTINAIKTWLALPQTEVMLFGTEKSCNFTAGLFPPGEHHCFQPPCINTEFNVPTYDCLFSSSSTWATTEYIMYANSDMALFDDVLSTLTTVGQAFDDFLIVGERIDLSYPRNIDFGDPNWRSKLRNFAKIYGKVHGKYAIDYFIYRRKHTRPMPPFLVGRVRWDNYLLAQFIGSKTAVAVDASKSIFAVHLKHAKIGTSATRDGTQWNKDLLKSFMVDPKKIGDLENTDYHVKVDPNVDQVNPCPNHCQLVRNRQSLEVLLYKAAVESRVIVASVNYGYLDFAINWLCSLRRVGLDNYLFHAMDRHVEQALFEMGHPVIFYESEDTRSFMEKASDESSESVEGVAYGTIAYQALMNTRTEFIYKLLQKGYNVLLCDVDIVFLRNPFLFMDDKLDIQGGAHKDTKITGGFVYMRGNSRALNIWTKVLHQHREVFRQMQKNVNFNPHEYTEQEVLNRLLLSSSTNEITWGRVPQEILADGKTFFIDKITQKTGIWPAAIHNNYIVGKNNKHARFVNTSLWFVEESLKCSPFPSYVPDPPRGMPSLVIKVLTFDRPESLKRLLKSIHKAKYFDDRVRLEIFIDTPENPEPVNAERLETIKLAKKFIWPHGEKMVVVREQHMGLIGQWLTNWYPTTDLEVALILEDDNVVSPLFYEFIKEALKRYYVNPSGYDPRVFGIMMQNQHFIPGKYGTKPKDLLDQRTQFYRYQQLSTWGPLFFPMHWAEFLTWQSERASDPNFTPMFSNMKTNEWFAARGGGRAVWSAFFMRFAAERGWYGIYSNFQDSAALVVNYRDKGVNFKADQGVNSPMLESLSGITLPESAYDMPLYDFHFNRITEDPSILELRGVYSDTFNVQTH